LAVRREVSFCETIYNESKKIEGVEAVKSNSVEEIKRGWGNGKIAVIIDPEWKAKEKIQPDVMVDAILAKKNLGTTMEDALLVIGLGPGFDAGRDVHMVIETNRGHNLGRIITSGCAELNTGIPGNIGGYTAERVLRSPINGVFQTRMAIGDLVKKGDIVGFVEGSKIQSKINGVIRGLIRSNIRVKQGLKLGDIDPRGNPSYCYTISDKARAVSGAVLEAILRK
jgi:xanthine dehydrogenase accessory factor